MKNKNRELLELIDKKINDELSLDEQSFLDHEISLNPSLSLEIDLHKEVDQALMETDVINLRKNLKISLTFGQITLLLQLSNTTADLGCFSCSV